jgi:hypothetical protein
MVGSNSSIADLALPQPQPVLAEMSSYTKERLAPHLIHP